METVEKPAGFGEEAGVMRSFTPSAVAEAGQLLEGIWYSP